MNPYGIEMAVEIARPVAEVFAAWTTADSLASWFAPMAISRPHVLLDFEVNGKYSIEMHMEGGAVFTTKGEFREIVPGKRIVMTWHCDAFPDPETLVTVDFQAIPDGTRVQLKHAHFRTTETCENHRAGWEACFASLTNYLEV